MFAEEIKDDPDEDLVEFTFETFDDAIDFDQLEETIVKEEQITEEVLNSQESIVNVKDEFPSEAEEFTTNEPVNEPCLATELVLANILPHYDQSKPQPITDQWCADSSSRAPTYSCGRHGCKEVFDRLYLRNYHWKKVHYYIVKDPKPLKPKKAKVRKAVDCSCMRCKPGRNNQRKNCWKVRMARIAVAVSDDSEESDEDQDSTVRRPQLAIQTHKSDLQQIKELLAKEPVCAKSIPNERGCACIMCESTPVVENDDDPPPKKSYSYKINKKKKTKNKYFIRGKPVKHSFEFEKDSNELRKVYKCNEDGCDEKCDTRGDLVDHHLEWHGQDASKPTSSSNFNDHDLDAELSMSPNLNFEPVSRPLQLAIGGSDDSQPTDSSSSKQYNCGQCKYSSDDHRGYIAHLEAHVQMLMEGQAKAFG